MTYVVITPDGELVEHHRSPRLADVEEHVGPEGPSRIALAREYVAAGWANDCGLIMPERYPRNVVGSCVLATMQANQQPYAGALVIAGYGYDESGWPLPLSDATLRAVREIHQAVRCALSPDGGGDMPQWVTHTWTCNIRQFAEAVRTGPTPQITIL